MVWPFSKHDPTPYLPGPEPVKKDDPPQYVSMDAFNKGMDEVRSMTSKLDQFAGLVTGALTSSQSGPAPIREAPPQEPAIDDITDEDYAVAVLQGDAAKITKRTKAEVERAKREIKHEYNARFSVLEGQGMGILDQVNTELGQQALAGMPYYVLLKQDIDAQLKTIPAHQRTPEMRQWIYQRTVGANLDKIKAHDQAEETRIRQEREALDIPGRTQSKDAKLTAASVFGEDILSPTTTWRGGGNLWARRTPDEWARARYGTKDINEAAAFASNVMAIDDCPRCFSPVVQGKCHCRQARSA